MQQIVHHPGRGPHDRRRRRAAHQLVEIEVVAAA
jgi:hypothetical protein